MDRNAAVEEILRYFRIELIANQELILLETLARVPDTSLITYALELKKFYESEIS